MMTSTYFYGGRYSKVEAHASMLMGEHREAEQR